MKPASCEPPRCDAASFADMSELAEAIARLLPLYESHKKNGPNCCARKPLGRCSQRSCRRRGRRSGRRRTATAHLPGFRSDSSTRFERNEDKMAGAGYPLSDDGCRLLEITGTGSFARKEGAIP